MLIRTLVAVSCAATLLAACAPGPWLDKSRLQDDLDAKTSTETYPVQPITPDVIMQQVRKVAIEQASSLPSDTAAWDYQIGTDDILGVTVWDHPELSSTSPAAVPESSVGAPPLPTSNIVPSDNNGHRVGSDGAIFFPTLGRVKVAGETIEQIRAQFVRLLSKNVRDPQVDVRVLAYRSQRVQMTGELKSPGTMAITDVPLTLVDAIARAGGENVVGRSLAPAPDARRPDHDDRRAVDPRARPHEGKRAAQGGRRRQRARSQRCANLRARRGREAADGADQPRGPHARRCAFRGQQHRRAVGPIRARST